MQTRYFTIKTITMAFTFLSTFIALNKLQSLEFSNYIFFQALMAISQELLCLGGNTESYKNNNFNLPQQNYLQEKGRLLISLLISMPFFIITRDSTSSILIAFFSVFSLLLLSSSPLLQTQENSIFAALKVDLIIGATGIVIRILLPSDLFYFTLLLATETLLKGIAYQTISLGIKKEKINITLKYYKSVALWGAGLSFQIISNRYESVFFKNQDAIWAMTVLTIAPPLLTVYYSSEVIIDRFFNKKSSHSVVIIILIISAIVIPFVLYMKNSANHLNITLSYTLFIAITLEFVYFSKKIIQSRAIRYFILSAIRLFIIVISSLLILKIFNSHFYAIVAAHIISFSVFYLLTKKYQ